MGLYVQAAIGVIMHLQSWIIHNDPGRTVPLDWPEVTSNLDHLANDEQNQDAMTMIVTDYFADRPEWAVDTVGCESGWDPWAVNPAGPYHNIWQVYRGTLGDVRQSTIEARSIFDRQGPGAWPVCGR